MFFVVPIAIIVTDNITSIELFLIGLIPTALKLITMVVRWNNDEQWEIMVRKKTQFNLTKSNIINFNEYKKTVLHNVSHRCSPLFTDRNMSERGK